MSNPSFHPSCSLNPGGVAENRARHDIFRQKDGSYVDSTGRKVTRFGFHNIRKAVSDYLTEGKKADVRTIQDTLRHENPEMTLSKYTESTLESRLAAQDVMASRGALRCHS
jgi:integrase